jgi:hypothetical protein
MEDFQAAFFQRHQDVEVLHDKQRLIASMHMGGIAVECLLKAMLCATLPRNASGEREWNTGSNNPGHTVYNPGHSYIRALRSHNRLYNRVMSGNQHILQWLERIENPECHFIDMRYIGKEPDDVRYRSWYDAYRRLIGWLQTQRF